LGGYIDPSADRIVVPYDFFYQITKKLNPAVLSQYKSRRLAALETLGQDRDRFSLWLEEGNTRTSTLYKPRTGDTPFLFFTDRVVWPRPLLGLVNFFWGAGSGLAGLFSLTTDGGEQIHQSFRAMFYSLPELVFCNIRKGTYGYEDLSTRVTEL